MAVSLVNSLVKQNAVYATKANVNNVKKAIYSLIKAIVNLNVEIKLC